jgi:hypothetical protein
MSIGIATGGKFLPKVFVGGAILYQRREEEKKRLNIEVSPLKMNKYISASFLKIESRSPSFTVNLKGVYND